MACLRSVYIVCDNGNSLTLSNNSKLSYEAFPQLDLIIACILRFLRIQTLIHWFGLSLPLNLHNRNCRRKKNWDGIGMVLVLAKVTPEFEQQIPNRMLRCLNCAIQTSLVQLASDWAAFGMSTPLLKILQRSWSSSWPWRNIDIW